MKYEFHPAAESEHLDAIVYYESKMAGLGAEYLSEFQTTINFIVKEPLSYPQSRNPGIRKANLHRFPFGIIYRMVDNKIQILAISHFHRKPEYWTKRV